MTGEFAVSIDRSILPQHDRDAIHAMLARFDVLKQNTEKPLVLITFDDLLHKVVSCPDEENLVSRLLALQPKAFGFNGTFFGIEETWPKMDAISGQKYTLNDEQRVIPTQYLPHHVNEAFGEMNNVIANDIKKRLLIESGFRSPAYQLIVVMHYLRHNEFSLERTLKRVALPGYSEHGSTKQQGLDVITIEGIPTHKDPHAFIHTDEYAWLVDNARFFGFQMSYTDGNADGVMFEPWHWSYRGR